MIRYAVVLLNGSEQNRLTYEPETLEDAIAYGNSFRRWDFQIIEIRETHIIEIRETHIKTVLV